MNRYYDVLNKRICDLKLDMRQTSINAYVKLLYKELSKRQLLFKPECYFADEWFVPEGDPVIGIPFYLANPLLVRVEREMMGEVEGDNKQDFMKLIRHEAGHAIAYAFRLHRKRSYNKTFGSISKMFVDHYKFNPRSKKHVQNIPNYYAQSHPDEDFAETFAVWLKDPPKVWVKRYKGWKALEKLYYVNTLMTSIAGQKPLVKRGEMMCHYKSMKITLWTYYMKRRALVETHRRSHQ